MDPTDRSMPPATMTGVSATASRPSSALNRVISNKFPTVKKLGASAEKNAISATRTTRSAHSPFGNHRCRHDRTLRHAPRATLGPALLAGRDLAEHEAGPVVLVNHAMAEKFWPGEDPIGRRILNFNTEQGGAVVIGVFGDHHQRSLRQAPQPALMLGIDQDPPSQLQLLVRTAGDAELLLPMMQRAIAELEPELLVQRPQTLEQRVERSYSEARLFAFLVAGFATLALALAAAGLYGVLAHSLRQRSRELGIRVALGATRGSIVALVLGQTGRMVGAGLLLGLAGALATGRALEGLLFGVEARDPLTIAGVALLVIVVASLAVLAPVRRAAATDPAVALRDE